MKRQAPFLIGLVLILAALPLGYFLFLHKPPPPPPPPPVVAPPPVVEAPVPDKPVEMEISEVSGTVEVRRKDGTWQKVEKGVTLRATDAVRTRDGSYAVLIGGESVLVRMDSGTEVTVEQLSDSLSRIMLASGMATTTVRPGSRHTFEVKAANSDAVARATEGTFTMSNDGEGTVAVGSREGQVEFVGNGKVVIVRAGQQSVVRPGSNGPSEPTPVPASLLRKVQWPAGRQNKREIVVQGQAEPGIRLEVGGETFSPSKDGSFTRTVALKEGENEVKIRAVSVGGSQQEDSQKFSVDTRPPVIKKLKTPWGNAGGQITPAQPDSP
ncbi:FecR domain-containing protein [Hyalangium rubrum]|uniref:FecR domain-containing protein n=1 Tax=Hyalangium rubrum TaxID=3103134 RepID=A0ABU5HHH4_9BACT|nr:FecR domain-containing protein [Hyalangium sp. s54d21]MDY7232584.1 FecR domain-containing protein [Hyalangium sp. s54d21]